MDLKNLTTKCVDPIKLGYLIDKKLDIMLDGYQRTDNKIIYPCFAKNSTNNKIDLLYPFEIKNLILTGQNISQFGVECNNLNMYTSTAYMKHQIASNPGQVFKYRIKEESVNYLDINQIEQPEQADRIKLD